MLLDINEYWLNDIPPYYTPVVVPSLRY